MSSHSPRSRRVRHNAQNRPHKIWLTNGQFQEYTYENPRVAASVLTGGSTLPDLITAADVHLTAMRKIVR